MNESKTLSDSKRAFHKTFHYVIPPLYRRITDELLVELHLLSHQKNFEPEGLFCLGLVKVFNAFTKGYTPQEHTNQLLKAICQSTGLNVEHINRNSEETLNKARGEIAEEMKSWLKGSDTTPPERTSDVIKSLSIGGKTYSRLISIGLLAFLQEGTGQESTDLARLINKTIEVADKAGLKKERVEKDLNLYKSNIDKLEQAYELMKEAIERQNKKLGNKTEAKEQ